MITLRPDQEKLKLDTYSAWNAGARNVCMVLPTGGGHVVICEGNAVVFDPAWYVVRDYASLDFGAWMVAVLVKQ